MAIINNQVRRRYTTEEAIIIRNWMSKYPSNYQEAFRRAAEELNRSHTSVLQSYYNHTSIVRQYINNNPIMGLVTNDILVEVNRY